MRRRLLAVVMLAVIVLVGRAEPEKLEAPEDPAPDAFADALAAMGIGPEDLGYRPKASWARYPHPKTVPYVLPFFEDLLAHPLDTYELTRTLGNAVEDLLTPERLVEAPTEKDRKETLFKLGVVLATDRRIGGFRGYSVNLDSRPDDDEPLLAAIATLRERAGDPIRRPMTFGNRWADDADEDPVVRLRKRIAVVPEDLRRPLAAFLLDLVAAREWIDRGLRRVPPDLRRAVFRTLPTLTNDTPDGTRYHEAIDDTERRIDHVSLAYGALKAMQACQDARRRLAAVAIPEGGWGAFRFRLATPWGTIAFDGPESAAAEVDDPLLIVRFGGDAALTGTIGATSADRPLSVALLHDFAGSIGGAPERSAHAEAEARDVNEGEVRESEATGRVASGVLGCGIVYASGAHANRWGTDRWGLGAGLFGIGVALDEGGDDVYRMRAAGQGAAFFGAGLLLDAAGDDRYELLEGDGQGFGGPGGIGVLADRRGDDRYFVERDAAKAGRGDYHSEDAIAVSNAQGVGSGRRGDGSDGHVWAGGLGVLIDVDGNDLYEAGNFSQGVGYWYGTGLLWDGGGNDVYRSVYFTQGSGAHFAIGALIDESGDDIHELGHNAGAGLGFGWDVVNAFLIDRGAGNDRYEAKIISYGLGEVRSNGIFIDEGGDDVYRLNRRTKGLGDVDEREGYTTPSRTAPFGFHLAQVGLFLDLGGNDTYELRDGEGRVTETREGDPGDGRTWNLRRRDPKARHGPNVSIGRDVARGRIGWLDPWPAREPQDETR